MVANKIKRLCDGLVALLGLIVLSPIFLLIALAIQLSMGRPVLFQQPRPGQYGRVFQFHKFRTMSNQRNGAGNLLPDAQRLTKVGAFLRKTSLDELPQLWNVLRGEMSLVGPRPLLVEYLDRYTPEQAHRHDVLPGITGWAQVNGRNALDWEERFQLDLWYVQHWSLWLDVKILALTVVKVLQRDGISQVGQATMSKFQGSKLQQSKLQENRSSLR